MRLDTPHSSKVGKPSVRDGASALLGGRQFVSNNTGDRPPRSCPDASGRSPTFERLRVYNSLHATSVTDKPTVFAFGTFDGVHRGHQALLRVVCERARALGGEAVVMTFANHPLEVLRPGFTVSLLTTPEQKCALLEGLGVDICLLMPFTRELAALTARQFVDAVEAMVHPRLWVVGGDVAFGRDREGNLAWLQREGIPVEVVAPVEAEGQRISSRRIRALLAEGRSAEATALL